MKIRRTLSPAKEKNEMTKTVKRLSVILFAGFAGLCAFFALLTFRSAYAASTVSATFYHGNDGASLSTVQVTTGTGTTFPASTFERRLSLKYGNDYEIYGVQYELNGQKFFDDYATFTAKTFTLNSNQTFYIYAKKDIKVKLMDGDTVKTTWQTSYDTVIGDVTLATVKGISGTYKAGYDIIRVDGLTETSKTFPQAGVRTLALTYEAREERTLTLMYGDELLGTCKFYSGQKFSDIDISGIDTDKGVGYTLVGWCIDKALQNQQTNDGVLTEDTTLYAKYNIEATVTLTFYKGDKVIITKKFLAGKSILLSQSPEILKAADAAASENETFTGWNFTIGGNTIFIKRDGLGGLGELGTDASLYGVYEPAEIYQASFYDGETLIATYPIKKGVKYQIYTDFEGLNMDDKLNKGANYAFKGISETKEDTGEYIREFTAEKDITFYIFYSIIGSPEKPKENYQAVFLIDGKIVYTIEQKKGEGIVFADYPELIEKTKKEGYVFKGWQSDNGEKIYVDELGKRTLNITLTAVYEKDDVKPSEPDESKTDKGSLFGLGISTGGLVLCGIAVYLLFFRKTRRR